MAWYGVKLARHLFQKVRHFREGQQFSLAPTASQDAEVEKRVGLSSCTVNHNRRGRRERRAVSVRVTAIDSDAVVTVQQMMRSLSKTHGMAFVKQKHARPSFAFVVLFLV